MASSEVVTSASAFLAGLTHTEPVAASQDIWEDAATLHFVQTGRVPDASTLMERDRIQHRVRCYIWREDHLLRVSQMVNEWCLPQGTELP